MVADEQHKKQRLNRKSNAEAVEDGPPVLKEQLHSYYKQYQQDNGNDLKQKREKLSENKDQIQNSTFIKLFQGGGENEPLTTPPIRYPSTKRQTSGTFGVKKQRSPPDTLQRQSLNDLAQTVSIKGHLRHQSHQQNNTVGVKSRMGDLISDTN